MQRTRWLKELLALALLVGSMAVHAQAACPPGTVPYGTGNDPSACGPDDSQLQEPAQPRLPPQIWVDHWGAMVSDDSLGKLGVAADKQDEGRAWQAAEEDCRAKGGLNCTRLISYRNQCIAMVLGDKTYSFSAGTTATNAIQQATKKCSASTTGCHVYYSACSLPLRVQ